MHLLAIDQSDCFRADVQWLGQCFSDTQDGPTGKASLQGVDSVDDFHLADLFFPRRRYSTCGGYLFEVFLSHSDPPYLHVPPLPESGYDAEYGITCQSQNAISHKKTAVPKEFYIAVY